MVWLVTHIWMSVGLAALLGLILGWAVRGIRFNGSARRAIVERDIALTELGQVRGELDSLYSSQRAQQDNSDSAVNTDYWTGEVEARDVRIGALETELSVAQSTIEQVRADGKKKLLAATAAAATAGAGATAVISGNQTSQERLDADVSAPKAELEWRNRYLESRVRTLETDKEQAPQNVEPSQPIVEDLSDRVDELETQNATLQSQLSDAQAELDNAASSSDLMQMGGVAALGAGAAIVGGGVADSAAPAENANHIDQAEFEKAKWKASYLTQRLAFLEANPPSDRNDVAGAATVQMADTPEAIPDAPSEQIADTTGTETETSPGEIEQELARLRWRNRYLEGRLAYIDGDGPEAAAKTEEDVQGKAAQALLDQLGGSLDAEN